MFMEQRHLSESKKLAILREYFVEKVPLSKVCQMPDLTHAKENFFQHLPVIVTRTDVLQMNQAHVLIPIIIVPGFWRGG